MSFSTLELRYFNLYNVLREIYSQKFSSPSFSLNKQRSRNELTSCLRCLRNRRGSITVFLRTRDPLAAVRISGETERGQRPRGSPASGVERGETAVIRYETADNEVTKRVTSVVSDDSNGGRRRTNNRGDRYSPLESKSRHPPSSLALNHGRSFATNQGSPTPMGDRSNNP